LDTTWIIKGSKLCNMRCAYCFEWDELDSADRITLDLWRKIFAAIREHHLQARDRDPRAKTFLTLHGGEPLVLPKDYRAEVMAMRDEILGDDPAFVNVIQTNLLHVTDEHVDWLERHAFHVGVSFDVVPGIRLTVGGRETERAVTSNMETLKRRGIPFGAIAVLARHNHARVTAVYDFFAERGIDFRILPLVPGPSTRAEERFATTHDENERALDGLFRHWIETGMKVKVRPLDLYLEATLRTLVGTAPVVRASRRAHGESTFVVNTDGALLVQDQDYSPPHRLGDLHTQPLGEILASDAWRRSVGQSEERLAQICGECEFAAGCTGSPVLSDPSPAEESGRCYAAYRAHRNIARYLTEAGLGREELRAILRAHFEHGTGAKRERAPALAAL
jgi:uncharacterized protein